MRFDIKYKKWRHSTYLIIPQFYSPIKWWRQKQMWEINRTRNFVVMNSSHWTMMSFKLLRYASFAVKWRTEYFRYCEIFEDSCFQVYHQYFALRIIRVINSKFTVKTFFFFNSIVLLGTVLHATRNDKVVFSWELISSHSREQSRLYSPLKKKKRRILTYFPWRNAE